MGMRGGSADAPGVVRGSARRGAGSYRPDGRASAARAATNPGTVSFRAVSIVVMASSQPRCTRPLCCDKAALQHIARFSANARVFLRSPSRSVCRRRRVRWPHAQRGRVRAVLVQFVDVLGVIRGRPLATVYALFFDGILFLGRWSATGAAAGASGFLVGGRLPVAPAAARHPAVVREHCDHQLDGRSGHRVLAGTARNRPHCRRTDPDGAERRRHSHLDRQSLVAETDECLRRVRDGHRGDRPRCGMGCRCRRRRGDRGVVRPSGPTRGTR